MIYLLMILATYRISRMVAFEDGPFDIFSLIRGIFDPDQKTWIGRGMNCPLCIGFWIAAAVVLMAGQFDLLTWFSVAGGAALLIKIER